MKVEQYSLGVKVSAVKGTLPPDERLGVVTIAVAVPTNGATARVAYSFRHLAGAAGTHDALLGVAEHGFDCCASLLEAVVVSAAQRERDRRQSSAANILLRRRAPFEAPLHALARDFRQVLAEPSEAEDELGLVEQLPAEADGLDKRDLAHA